MCGAGLLAGGFLVNQIRNLIKLETYGIFNPLSFVDGSNTCTDFYYFSCLATSTRTKKTKDMFRLKATLLHSYKFDRWIFCIYFPQMANV